MKALCLHDFYCLMFCAIYNDFIVTVQYAASCNNTKVQCQRSGLTFISVNALLGPMANGGAPMLVCLTVFKNKFLTESVLRKGPIVL